MKVSISLTVVMGITWIIGILVIEVEGLFAVAFIFTIFVAFQGVFIFVVLVLFSKQVRESYTEWWKAKVAKSKFLNKHFGEKRIPNSTTCTIMTNVDTENETRYLYNDKRSCQLLLYYNVALHIQ